MIDYDVDTIKRFISSALEKLEVREKNIILNDINERTIAHRLAVYLGEYFKEYDIDVEYNRNIEKGKHEPKYVHIIKDCFREAYQKAKESGDDIQVFMEQVTTYPDIIVHERGNNKHNILVIEIKKSNNKSDWEIDKRKLEGFTRKDDGYAYKIGLHLIIKISEPWSTPECEWYENGEKK
jgi:hypothetical protein